MAKENEKKFQNCDLKALLMMMKNDSGVKIFKKRTDSNLFFEVRKTNF